MTPDKIETFIAKNTIISGDIQSTEGTIRIDGTVSGENIKSKGIIIGSEATVTANLEAEIIIVSGKVNGNIKASKKLEILNQAKVIGNIEAPLLAISEGSIFQGNSIMTAKN